MLNNISPGNWLLLDKLITSFYEWGETEPFRTASDGPNQLEPDETGNK
jgi:hypothetical protein